ncbi:MAG: S8 family serine peptidase [Verrucomicrobiota bacterium]
MSHSRSYLFYLFSGGLLLLSLFIGIWLGSRGQDDQIPVNNHSPGAAAALPEPGMLKNEFSPGPWSSDQMANESTADLGVLGNVQFPARPNEALLIFKTEEFFQGFPELAREFHLQIKESLPKFRSIRIGFQESSDFFRFLSEHGDILIYEDNLIVSVPPIPRSDAQATGLEKPFKNLFFQSLGIEEVQSEWGQGVKIAILDSGVSDHITLEGRVFQMGDFTDQLDEGPVAQSHAHGTAVASLAAGSHSLAPGVAPSAEILSYRILDENGKGDMFALSRALVQAVDDGVDVINLSLGTYGESEIVRMALEYAQAAKVAVVAAIGNDGIEQIAFPANAPNVISVGSIDANHDRVWFSNSGESLDLVAPGYQLYAGVPEDGVAMISGTSMSAPLVSGMIAALLSLDSQLSGLEAGEIIKTYTHDAGLAGRDPEHGGGIPNWRRLTQAEKTGVRDVGVSGVVLLDEGKTLHIAVQNRGTSIEYNLPVTASFAGQKVHGAINRLDPGLSDSAQFSMPIWSDDWIEVTAEVSLPATDENPDDNEITRVLLLSREIINQ